MQRYKIYFNQILENIEKIKDSLKNKNKKDLEEDSNLKDATLMRIQIIGENINKIPFKIKSKYPQIKWNRIKDSRDIISHAYSDVNTDIIWDLIKKELPKLKEVLQKIENSE